MAEPTTLADCLSSEEVSCLFIPSHLYRANAHPLAIHLPQRTSSFPTALRTARTPQNSRNASHVSVHLVDEGQKPVKVGTAFRFVVAAIGTVTANFVMTSLLDQFPFETMIARFL